MKTSKSWSFIRELFGPPGLEPNNNKTLLNQNKEGFSIYKTNVYGNRMLAPKLSNNLEKRERIVMFNVFNDNMTKNKTFIFLLECVYCSNSLYNKKSSFLGLASIFMLMFLP